MNYATIKKFDVANGPGVRVSLFVSGCTHGCKNCFNKEAWDFSYGNPFTEQVKQEIFTALDNDFIQGFSLLGGEPFEPQNQQVLMPLLREIRQRFPQKNIWCYSGYMLDKELWEESRARCDVTDEMLSYIDVLVDGRFVEELKNLSIRFRGSSNQRIIDVQKSLKQHKVITIADNEIQP
ncbi:MAG: anaerobic ribonucleoside-triphosphate reductase activating protein [Clostridia bacterium]|nr:anaerobic ribonucleoside-triphosphate reductase activating protein [Clostridia bacterium]